MMMLLEAPGQPQSAMAATVTPIAKPREPLPILSASAFDISKTVAVNITGKPGTTGETAAVAVSSPSAAEAVPAATTTDSGGATMMVADAVNMRLGPDKSSKRIDVARPGTMVSVLQSERGWSLVATDDGRKGWLATKFLQSAQ
ncbi:MAG: SH3 domain-containing protein [Alphaproteobacteria bacterium]|nr:SH3 domain-containing protein [Alphaproteobacteria bacterium]